jgi:hypothetical protein
MSELDEDARAQIAEVLATVAEQGLHGPRDTDVALDAIEAVITAIPTEQDALRDENARLREALSGLMNEYGGTRALPHESPRAEAARAALEIKP